MTLRIGIQERLRRARAKRIMPLIGNLLDRWEFLENDIKGTLRMEAPALCAALDQIEAASEGKQLNTIKRPDAE